MKILSKNNIKEIESILYAIENNTKIDNIKTMTSYTNEIRKICGIPITVRIPVIPSNIPPMPKVKPPKKEEHIHDFMILYSDSEASTICCRNCGEIKHIQNNVPFDTSEEIMERKEYIKISIEELEEVFDNSKSIKEAKEWICAKV